MPFYDRLLQVVDFFRSALISKGFFVVGLIVDLLVNEPIHFIIVFIYTKLLQDIFFEPSF